VFFFEKIFNNNMPEKHFEKKSGLPDKFSIKKPARTFPAKK